MKAWLVNIWMELITQARYPAGIIETVKQF